MIGPLERDHRNHRVFSDNDLAWIGVVTCMKDAGLAHPSKSAGGSSHGR